MLPVEKFENINDKATVDFLRNIRRKYSGLCKVYGTRYLDALAKVCNYRVNDYGKVLLVGCGNATRKEFKSNKETGQYMEATIQDLIKMGIIKA